MFEYEATLPLSVVLVCFDMARELPRTVHTLAPPRQIGIEPAAYEIIVVDNGSRQTIDADALRRIAPHLRFLTYPNPTHSPVAALNYGIAQARGHVICACIDAARMATPGLLSRGLAAARLHPRAVVGALAWHLGLEEQNIGVTKGYDQEREDALLATVDWNDDSYALFKIASLDPSSQYGMFAAPSESNALFMSRPMWTESGGFDPRFTSKGGGLVNLDLWIRLCADPANEIIVLLGEGTFHQVHGGTATNAPVSLWPVFHDEYKRITGKDFAFPTVIPIVYGKLNPHARALLEKSSAEEAWRNGLFRGMLGARLARLLWPFSSPRAG